MNISPIAASPSNSDPVVQQPSVQSSQKQPAPLPGTGAQNTEDTVHLSQEAQIQQMALQGESSSEIAGTTGLSVSEVDIDLGISATSSSVPIAAPGGQGGGHPAAAAQAAAPAAASNAAPTATSAPTLSARA